MVTVLALTGAALFILAGLGATARLVHTGNLDAQALAEKLATPWSLSALDWPELRVDAVVPQPGRPSLVLVHARRPGHASSESTLLLQLDGSEGRGGESLLSRWCERGNAVSPSCRGCRGFELRRRQTRERVCAQMLAEDAVPAPRVRARV